MPRPKLQPGEHSPIEVHAYREVEGRKTRADNARQATTWRARCSYRADDGTLQDVTRWARTKRAAEEAAKAALLDKRHTDAESVLTPSSRFVDAGAVWLEWIKRPEAKLSAKSQSDYRAHYFRHIDTKGSPLRGRTVAQVNDAQRLILFLQAIADSKGSQTAKVCRTILSGILGLCVRRGVVPVNAARSVGTIKAQAPKDDGRDRTRAFDDDEQDAVIAKADEWATSGRIAKTRSKWHAVADLLAFMAGTGCRINEARLLQWSDLDLVAGRVHIRGTKTTGSDRKVNLPVWLQERLQARLAMVENWPYSKPYVFATERPEEVRLPDGGYQVPGTNVPLDQSNLHGWVREVLDEAEVSWAVPHTFRRTVATKLDKAGFSPRAIADQLGHADPSMTMKVYMGRDLEGDKADLAAVL